MGNTNGGGPEPFRRETVESAHYATRPLNSGSSNSGPVEHHGVVVNTKEGNSWLIHQPGPNQMTTVTSASNMSNRWVKDHDIPVNGTHTVQEVYNGAGGRTTSPLMKRALKKLYNNRNNENKS